MTHILVSIPTLAPRRSMIRMLTCVVLCSSSPLDATSWTSPPNYCITPVFSPRAGSSGVVRHLCSRTAPVSSSTRMKSVKVPPMSRPTRYRDRAGRRAVSGLWGMAYPKMRHAHRLSHGPTGESSPWPACRMKGGSPRRQRRRRPLRSAPRYRLRRRVDRVRDR
jgi:hypothetical protein